MFIYLFISFHYCLGSWVFFSGRRELKKPESGCGNLWVPAGYDRGRGGWRWWGVCVQSTDRHIQSLGSAFDPYPANKKIFCNHSSRRNKPYSLNYHYMNLLMKEYITFYSIIYRREIKIFIKLRFLKSNAPGEGRAVMVELPLPFRAALGFPILLVASKLFPLGYLDNTLGVFLILVMCIY